MQKPKSGDIFSITLSNKKIGFIQYIFQDEYYLGGHLIRSFDFKIAKHDNIILDDLVNNNILFYAYTRLIEGIKKGLWERVGNVCIENKFKPPIFRNTPDVYSEVRKSSQWRKFKSGTPRRIYIGELSDEDRKLPVAGVFPPEAIIKQIETGWHGFMIPE